MYVCRGKSSVYRIRICIIYFGQPREPHAVVDAPNTHAFAFSIPSHNRWFSKPTCLEVIIMHAKCNPHHNHNPHHKSQITNHNHKSVRAKATQAQTHFPPLYLSPSHERKRKIIYIRPFSFLINTPESNGKLRWQPEGRSACSPYIYPTINRAAHPPSNHSNPANPTPLTPSPTPPRFPTNINRLYSPQAPINQQSSLSNKQVTNQTSSPKTYATK